MEARIVAYSEDITELSSALMTLEMQLAEQLEVRGPWCVSAARFTLWAGAAASCSLALLAFTACPPYTEAG